MARRAHMMMSLDGFITGPGDDLADPLGDGGERPHDWITPPMQPPGSGGYRHPSRPDHVPLGDHLDTEMTVAIERPTNCL